jgi:hypothetical protein
MEVANAGDRAMATADNPTDVTPQPEAVPGPSATADAQPGATPRPGAKQKPSMVRNIIGLVLLVVIVTVGVLEYTAYQQYSTAVGKVDDALFVKREDPTLDQVEAMVGRKADHELTKVSGAEKETTFTWRGVFRTHQMKAYFFDLPPLSKNARNAGGATKAENRRTTVPTLRRYE